MTTLDEAERRLDHVLGRLEDVSSRLAAWREAEAVAERRAAEAERQAQERVLAAESEAGRRVAEAEEARSAALAERDAATGEQQVLRDRCAELDRLLQETRTVLEHRTVETSGRIAGLESQLGARNDEHRRLAEQLRELEAAATEEVSRLDALCAELRQQLATAQATADRLAKAAQAALGSLEQGLQPRDDDG